MYLVYVCNFLDVKKKSTIKSPVEYAVESDVESDVELVGTIIE